MKTFYIVNQNLMNGTVMVNSMQSCFLTKELAEKTIDRLKVINKKNDFFDIIYNIKEVQLYEDESEVPCLNKKQYGNENAHT